MPKKIGHIVWRVFMLLLYVLVSGLTIFFAYGYKYDFKEGDVQKTSIIDIMGEEKGVEVWLDGVKRSVDIPSQLNNVIPGSHVLSVNREGYLPWKRTLEVDANLVSIVDDVYLVPEDVEGKVQKVAELDKGRKIFKGEDFFAEVEDGADSFDVLTLFPKGTPKRENIGLFDENLTDMKVHENGDFLLYLDEGYLAVANFSAGRFLKYMPPDEAEEYRLGWDNQILYFLKGGDLYAVPYRQLENLGEKAEDFLARKNVSAYAVSQNGNILFISEGTVYECDYACNKAVSIGFGAGMFQNLSVKRGGEFAMLILRDVTDRRFMCVFRSAEDIACQTDRLKGPAFMNAYDQVLYAESDGRIYFYDPRLAEKKLLVEAGNEETELIGWFSKQGHFVYRNDGKVYLGDVNIEGVGYELLSDLEGITDYVVLEKALFYLKDGNVFKVL